MEITNSKLKDIKPSQKNIFITEVQVVESGPIEEYTMQGQKVKVCNGKVIDDSIGEPISITAWGFAAQFLSGAKKVCLENVYAKEYQGKIQISTGKFGRIKRII